MKFFSTDNNDSTAIFETESDKLELIITYLLSPGDFQENKFEKLIENKEFDLALKALKIAEEKDTSGRITEQYSLRKKSILLMRRDSFDSVWFSFPGDLILTERNKKQGLYDRYGKELFEPQFDYIDPVHFYQLYCTNKDGKYGLIHYSGKELFKPQFDGIDPEVFPDFYRTELNNKFGLISIEGEELFKPQFDDMFAGECFISYLYKKRK